MMSSPTDRGSVEGILATRGYAVEAFITRSAGRAIIIAAVDDERHLVSILGPRPALDGASLDGRSPWDLDLVEVASVGADTAGPGTVLIERLPKGVPTTRISMGSTEIPPFATALAEQVAACHASGQLVGPLHPALVFADPLTSALAGCAQRPLRIAAAHGPSEGQAPLFDASYRTRGEIRGDPVSETDDVFRLAAMLWRWRHGTDPFGGGGMDELSGIVTGDPVTPVTDALDRRLVEAFSTSHRDRPGAAELVAALRAFDGSWSGA
jgi:hypothetical protein